MTEGDFEGIMQFSSTCVVFFYVYLWVLCHLVVEYSKHTLSMVTSPIHTYSYVMHVCASEVFDFCFSWNRLSIHMISCNDK